MNPQTADDDAPDEFAPIDLARPARGLFACQVRQGRLRQVLAMVDDLYHEELMEAAESSTARASPMSATSWRTSPQAAPQNTTSAALIATHKPPLLAAKLAQKAPGRRQPSA